MSEARFTKGPWNSKGVYGQGEIYAPKFADGLLNQPDRIVADCNHAVGGVIIGTVEFYANVQLIAASPDLYNALSRIMHYAYTGAAACDVDTTEQPEFVRARAALAKARGENKEVAA